MKLVIVPSWVENSLALVKKSYTALVDPKVLSTLSKEDLSFYDLTIDLAAELLPQALLETIPLYNPILGDGEIDWTLHYSLKRDREAASGLYSACNCGENCNCISYNVFGGPIKSVPEKSTKNVLSFLTINIEDEWKTGYMGFELLSEENDVFFIRLIPIHSRDEAISCYDDILSVLNKKYKMDEIASMPLFKAYETLIMA